jgi:hypothetical protein
MATRTTEQQISMTLTEVQRRLTAELAPELADRLKLSERNARVIRLSAQETRSVLKAAQSEVSIADGVKRNSLRHLIDKAETVLSRPVRGDDGHKLGEVYRFKITLLDFEPPIWRRIEVKDCTFDKLHEHIQTAMGWTNSHLHQFELGGQTIGDPELLDDGFMGFQCVDSTETKLSQILAPDARRFAFLYEYDFGDGWRHEVLLEEIGPAEKGKRYPVCVQGERCCPPEDVGGVWGYAEFLEALDDPEDERHAELLQWCGGSFDSEHFDAEQATRAMKRGLPDWRY